MKQTHSMYTDPVIEDAVDEYLSTRDEDDKHLYHNYYRCHCGREWDDLWSCTCDDRCPRCNSAIEAYRSEDV